MTVRRCHRQRRRRADASPRTSAGSPTATCSTSTSTWLPTPTSRRRSTAPWRPTPTWPRRSTPPSPRTSGPSTATRSPSPSRTRSSTRTSTGDGRPPTADQSSDYLPARPAAAVTDAASPPVTGASGAGGSAAPARADGVDAASARWQGSGYRTPPCARAPRRRADRPADARCSTPRSRRSTVAATVRRDRRGRGRGDRASRSSDGRTSRELVDEARARSGLAATRRRHRARSVRAATRCSASGSRSRSPTRRRRDGSPRRSRPSSTRSWPSPLLAAFAWITLVGALRQGPRLGDARGVRAARAAARWSSRSPSSRPASTSSATPRPPDAAARRPGVMGAGLYLVWPAFYTDVTDSYRLGRGGRLRTDLGGLYFNAIVAVAHRRRLVGRPATTRSCCCRRDADPADAAPAAAVRPLRRLPRAGRPHRRPRPLPAHRTASCAAWCRGAPRTRTRGAQAVGPRRWSPRGSSPWCRCCSVVDRSS